MRNAQLIVPGRGHGLASLERAETAAAYHRRFGASKVIFTGGAWILGKAGQEKSEATLMYDHVKNKLDCPVELDHDADTSFRNFMNCLSWLDQSQDLGVVTHSDHMGRLMMLAQKIAPNRRVFAVVVPGNRCSLHSWFAEVVLCEFSRALFVGADKRNLDRMQRRYNLIEQTAQGLRQLYKPSTT